MYLVAQAHAKSHFCQNRKPTIQMHPISSHLGHYKIKPVSVAATRPVGCAASLTHPAAPLQHRGRRPQALLLLLLRWGLLLLLLLLTYGVLSCTSRSVHSKQQRLDGVYNFFTPEAAGGQTGRAVCTPLEELDEGRPSLDGRRSDGPALQLTKSLILLGDLLRVLSSHSTGSGS